MRRTIQKDDSKRIVTSADPEFDARLADLGTQSYETYETRSFTECVFIDRDYYVQTITDADDTVLAFSVTTRSRRFRPTYKLPFRPRYFERHGLQRKRNFGWAPIIHVKLGRTRFADLDRDNPDQFAPPHFKVSVGAHNWTYSELRYLANPGYYLTVVLTASDVAAQTPVGEVFKVQQELGGAEWPDPAKAGNEPGWEALPTAQQFRRDTVITTYTVIGIDLWDVNYPSTFGPHLNLVRTLP